MRLGVFSILDRYEGVGSAHPSSRYEQALELARTADRLGYDAFWVAEHHFQRGGALPAPPVFLAAAARETRRIRLGALVAVLPLHSPRELAEQYALADALAQGRLEIGLGSGYVPVEFRGFGLGDETRRADFDRNLPEFLAALSGEPLPVAATPGDCVVLNVRSVQSPHPPVWIAAVRPEAVRAVGTAGRRLALVPYVQVDRIEALESVVASYRSSLPRGVAPRVLAALHVHVGVDSDSAEAALQRFLDSRLRPESSAFRAYQAVHPALTSAAAARRRGLALFGSTEEVAEQLQRLASFGVTDIAGIFDFGGLPQNEVLASLRRCAPLLDSPSDPVEVGRIGDYGSVHAAVGVPSEPPPHPV